MSINREILEAQARISGLCAQNDQLRRESVDNDAMNTILKAEIEKLQDGNNEKAMLNVILEDKIDGLKAEIEQLKAQLQTSKENCFTLLDTNKKLESERDGLKAHENICCSMTDNAREEVEKLEVDLKKAQEEAMDWKADYETISNGIDNGTWPPPKPDMDWADSAAYSLRLECVNRELVTLRERLEALEMGPCGYPVYCTNYRISQGKG